MKNRAARFAPLLAFSFLSAATAHADIVSVETVATGFDRVTNIRHVAAAGDHLYVSEQVGRIRIVHMDGNVDPEPFLDIQDQVLSGHFETGLTGLAFAPGFPADPRVFVHYTRQDGASVISRFLLAKDDPLLADPASELVMMVIAQPNPEHNCNQLEFGPDGMLYIGCGDGGNAVGPLVDPQRLDHLLGKILRVNVTDLLPGERYRIPGDNPFLKIPDARPETWHYGLRNPYRFGFDEATGDLWIGDVGMLHWEEINHVPAGLGGQNFGWPILEGTHCWPNGSECAPPEGLWMPVYEFPHQGACAVVGGVRLRDPAQPTLDGRYLYADFCTGRIFALRETQGGTFVSMQLGAAPGRMLTTFGRAPDGGVLLGTYDAGSVLRLVVNDAIFADGFEESEP